MHFYWITPLICHWHAVATTLQIWLVLVSWLLVFECLLGFHFGRKEAIMLIRCLLAHIGWNTKDSWCICVSLLGASPGILWIWVYTDLRPWAVRWAKWGLWHSHIHRTWQLFHSLGQVSRASNYGLCVPGKGFILRILQHWAVGGYHVFSGTQHGLIQLALGFGELIARLSSMIELLNASSWTNLGLKISQASSVAAMS